MKWKHIAELTDSQLVKLAKEVFKVDEVSEIERSGKDEVYIYVLTHWGEGDAPIEETAFLTDIDFYIKDWLITAQDRKNYRQYLFALGVHPLAFDNPYMEGGGSHGEAKGM